MMEMVRLLPIMLSGIATGELYQWCVWKTKNPDKKWGGYWKEGLPHMGTNLVIVISCFVAWHCGVLSSLVSLFGGTPIAQLLAVSPPVGFLITVGSDIMGDQIGYALRVRAKRFLKGRDSSSSSSTPTLPTASPQEGTT